jgi:hypothetical protein
MACCRRGITMVGPHVARPGGCSRSRGALVEHSPRVVGRFSPRQLRLEMTTSSLPGRYVLLSLWQLLWKQRRQKSLLAKHHQEIRTVALP